MVGWSQESSELIMNGGADTSLSHNMWDHANCANPLNVAAASRRGSLDASVPTATAILAQHRQQQQQQQQAQLLRRHSMMSSTSGAGALSLSMEQQHAAMQNHAMAERMMLSMAERRRLQILMMSSNCDNPKNLQDVMMMNSNAAMMNHQVPPPPPPQANVGISSPNNLWRKQILHMASLTASEGTFPTQHEAILQDTSFTLNEGPPVAHMTSVAVPHEASNYAPKDPSDNTLNLLGDEIVADLKDHSSSTTKKLVKQRREKHSHKLAGDTLPRDSLATHAGLTLTAHSDHTQASNYSFLEDEDLRSVDSSIFGGDSSMGTLTVPTPSFHRKTLKRHGSIGNMSLASNDKNEHHLLHGMTLDLSLHSSDVAQLAQVPSVVHKKATRTSQTSTGSCCAMSITSIEAGLDAQVAYYQIGDDEDLDDEESSNDSNTEDRESPVPFVIVPSLSQDIRNTRSEDTAHVVTPPAESKKKSSRRQTKGKKTSPPRTVSQHQGDSSTANPPSEAATGTKPGKQTFEDKAGDPVDAINPDVDVFLGRGGGATSQKGNKRYQQIVMDHMESYMECSNNEERNQVAMEILEEIQSNGARFVFHNKEDGLDYEITQGATIKKIRQRLRENVYKMKDSSE